MSAVPALPNDDHQSTVRTGLTGIDLLLNPRLNKGTAFTEEERDAFALNGLLPPHVGTLDDQRERRKKALDLRDTPFGKYSLMRDLQDTNETLFYSLIARHTEELLPIVYTPIVGEGCQRFSEIWRRPRGLFLSYPNRDRIEQILADPRYDNIRCIVVSDGERILGLGDQGAGGMGIPIGKMALYTALAGIPPEHCLPILLDVGTERRWPHILLQWEDFAGTNAATLLDRYRNRLCTFNDDIQGTAAVTTATLLAAVNATGIPLKEQTIALFGSGGAGVGIANLLIAAMQEEGLTEAQARGRIYAFNRYGLLVEDARGIRESQQPWVRPRADVKGWKLAGGEDISLLDVVNNANITALVGTSAQAGAFTEDIVRAMASHAERPIIFPLSNPTSRAEARPSDLDQWTDGRALIATGSPFAPVKRNGVERPIAQCNNVYIFPAMGLAVTAAQATRVTDEMMRVAAAALGDESPALADPDQPLLPAWPDVPEIAVRIAHAVAVQAVSDGVAPKRSGEELNQRITEVRWIPEYRE